MSLLSIRVIVLQSSRCSVFRASRLPEPWGRWPPSAC